MSANYANMLNAFKNGNIYQPHISSIVFSNYKNIQSGEELTLDFPLTLLLGKNGTNKSSILHALFGCPLNYNVGEYWFSTHTDPIYRDPVPAYFYRYKTTDFTNEAEVLYTMQKKLKADSDPDYWETSRPLKSYGMKGIPKELGNRLRWPPIDKKVIYLDFRAQISAFDKVFHRDGSSEPVRRRETREKLRKRSKALKEAIASQNQNQMYYGKQRIKINHLFDQEIKDKINYILGSEYEDIRYIEHDFYLSGGFSIHLKKKSSTSYTEAFAGSGETSIVRLVYALENAPAKALVLLDEPETSLHIEAQYRLREYILEKIKSKKLQVVISTHSPFFAKGLPECAIKVLNVDDSSKKVRIINSAPAEESSFHLGYRRNEENKVYVYVEDSLAKALCQHVITKKLSQVEADRLSIQYYIGGKDDLLILAASESTKASSNLAFLFDGDSRPKKEIPDEKTIPVSENENLKNIVKELFGVETKKLKFPQDSGQKEQEYANLRNFLRCAKERFRYLPCNTPEEFLVANNSNFSSTQSSSAQQAKEALEKYAKSILGSSGTVNAEQILTVHRMLLGQIADDTGAYNETAKILQYFKQFAPSLH